MKDLFRFVAFFGVVLLWLFGVLASIIIPILVIWALIKYIF